MNNRFCFYIENNKTGIIDKKTRKIILHSSYDVNYFLNDIIYLKNGETLSFEKVLKQIDFISKNQRYVIVEDDVSKKVGIYDTRFQQLRVPCTCDKIHYFSDKKIFVIYKNNKIRHISYGKVGRMNYFCKEDGVIRVDNLSVYYEDCFVLNLKNGKKIELKK